MDKLHINSWLHFKFKLENKLNLLSFFGKQTEIISANIYNNILQILLLLADNIFTECRKFSFWVFGPHFYQELLTVINCILIGIKLG